MARMHGFGSFSPRTSVGARTAMVALTVAFSAMVPASLVGQTGSVSGTARDESTGQPLVGAQVSISGTTLGVITNAAGMFRLDNVPVGTIELRAVRLGYSPASRTVQVVAGQVATENLDLAVSAVSLDALVATATGLQRRREIGNSLATLQVSREMRRVAPTTVVSLLQGRAPGVTILQGSGSVGTSSSIKVRGNTSINLSNTPLVYIDGARVSNAVASGPSVGGQSTSRLNDLDAREIESIEVVKGPSAATLYGTEAAAGVLRITTRRGRPGATEWRFFSEMGSNWDDTVWPDNVFNPRSFFGTAAADTLYRMNLLEQLGTDLTPWRTGGERAFGGSMRGGVETVTYFLSGSWDSREGNLPNNEATRRNVRANFNLAPSPNVDLAVSTSFGSHEVTLPDSDNNVYGYLGVALVAFPWELPIRRDDPVTGEEDVRTCPIDYEFSRLAGAPLGSIGCQANPFFSERTFEDVATLDNRQHIERFTGSATLEYRPLTFLSGRGTFGYDQYSDQTGGFIPVDPDQPFGEDSRGIRSIDNAVIRHLTLQGDISATFDVAPDVRSTTSVGVQYYRQKVESAGAVGRFLPTGSKLVSSAVRTEGGEGVGETRNVGVYLEQQVGWRDRVFVTPAVRVDDNAAFGENLGRKAYPRIMASWVVSEEAWFDNLMPGAVVESLRLRGAWGKSGKHPSSTAAVTILGSQRVTFRGNDEAGITICCPGNPDLKPETGQETELGFEADLLEGRLGLDFTWFKKVAVDAIVSRGLAPSTGYPSSVATNIGEIENSGVELSLFAVAVDRGAVFWDWQVNLATVKGEITQLDEPIIYGVNGDSQRHEQGYPYGAYFSRDYFIDEDGEVDSTEEPVYQGHTTPEWDGSVSTSVTLLDRITLYANLGFAGGHQLFNSTEEFRCGFLGGGTYGGICPQLFEKDAEGERTDAARLKGAAGEDVQYSPWIEDADFARLRTVSVRFDIPEAWVQRFGAVDASFMLAAENMALWTPYTGIDPEINSDGASQSTRLEFLTVPPPKRFTGRLEITF